MISHSKKFIFIHVYKTGGTSIRTVLMPYTDEITERQRMINRVFDKAIGWKPITAPDTLMWSHAGVNEYRALLGAEYDGYFSFGFVRNPFDWLVSIYEYVRQSPRHHLYPLARHVDFAAFVGSGVSETQRLQKDFLYTPAGQLGVDRLGRFESLEADFAQIARTLEITAPLPHLNKANRNPLGHYYTDALRRQVAESLAPDFEAFGYDPTALPDE